MDTISDVVEDHPSAAPFAVVTGASSGIGAATVAALRQDGWKVLAVARRQDRLAQLAEQTGCDYFAADLTDPEQVKQLGNTLPDKCDLLVNNAGGALGVDTVQEGSRAEWQRMYELNVLLTLEVTQAALPAIEAAQGAVLTVTSTASFVAYEGGGGYCAAKAAERMLVDTLRLELCGRPIRVMQIAPGMVATDEFSVNRMRGDADAAAAVYAGVEQPLVAADVAETIRWAAALPPHVNIDLLVVRPTAQAAQHKVART